MGVKGVELGCRGSNCEIGSRGWKYRDGDVGEQILRFGCLGEKTEIGESDLKY